MIQLTSSGSVSDYSDPSVTSSLQQNIANAAGVHPSLVTISVTAASVIITANIAVPASSAATTVMASLSSTLSSPAAASAALGITIAEMPSLVNALTPTTPPAFPLGPPPYAHALQEIAII